MANQSLAGLFIVGPDAVFRKESAERVADVVQDTGLELAVRAGDDAVGASGVEADAGVSIPVQPHRELDFVAVTVHFGEGRGGSTGTSSPPMRRNASVTLSPLARSSAA